MTIGSSADMLREFDSPAPTMGRLTRVRYTHEAMIELIIANPWISQNQIAAHFGYSPAWISNILASDAFQSRLAERREEIIDPMIKATIEERFKALVIQSLNVLQEKMSLPAHQVDGDLALKAAEIGAKALGYGARGADRGTQVNFVVQLPTKAASPEAWAADHVTIDMERTNGNGS